MEGIPYNELAAALDRKGATPNCPSCGGTEIARTEDDRLAFVELMMKGGGALTPGRNEGFAAAVLICDNCGLIRWYAPQHLLED